MIVNFKIVYKDDTEYNPDSSELCVSTLSQQRQVKYYCWQVAGETFKRYQDKVETQHLFVAPNCQYLLALQDSESYGADNLLVLNMDGSEFKRLKNPYCSSPEFQVGDVAEFSTVQSTNDGRVLARISVKRSIPGKLYLFEPTYGTFYDSHTWECSPIEFIDSRNL